MARQLKPANAFIIQGEEKGYYTGAGFSEEISEAAKYPYQDIAEIIIDEDLEDDKYSVYEVPA